MIVPDNAVLSLWFKSNQTYEVDLNVKIVDYSVLIEDPFDPNYTYPDSFALFNDGSHTEVYGWTESRWSLDFLVGHDVEIVIGLRSYGTCGIGINRELYVDDVSLAPAAEPTPPGVKNGGFETGDLDEWYEDEYGTAQASISYSQLHSGTYSARLEYPFNCDTAGLRQRLIVPNNATLSFWSKSTQSTGGTFSVRILDYSNETLEWVLITVLDRAIGLWDWNETVYDLSSLAGHYIELQFFASKGGLCADPWGAEIFLDDISIREDIAPNVFVLSPENKTYPTSSVPLNFTVDELTSWTGYSLDGQDNVTITGNTTLTGLLDGPHYVLVYTNDTFGNMGASNTIYFTVDTTPPNVTDVSQTPPMNSVLPEDEVKVNATVTDDLSEVKQVTLVYAYANSSGIWARVVDMTNLEGNVWNATIPAFPYCTNVTYTIMAQDNVGNTITTQEMGYEYQYHVIPEFPSFFVLPLLILATLLAVTVYRRKHSM